VDAKHDIQLFADHAGDVARTCELLQADARNSLDFHIARQGEIQVAHSREYRTSGAPTERHGSYIPATDGRFPRVRNEPAKRPGKLTPANVLVDSRRQFHRRPAGQ
jgi:hypothetical protein